MAPIRSSGEIPKKRKKSTPLAPALTPEYARRRALHEKRRGEISVVHPTVSPAGSIVTKNVAPVSRVPIYKRTAEHACQLLVEYRGHSEVMLRLQGCTANPAWRPSWDEIFTIDNASWGKLRKTAAAATIWHLRNWPPGDKSLFVKDLQRKARYLDWQPTWPQIKALDNCHRQSDGRVLPVGRWSDEIAWKHRASRGVKHRS